MLNALQLEPDVFPGYVGGEGENSTEKIKGR